LKRTGKEVVSLKKKVLKTQKFKLLIKSFVDKYGPVATSFEGHMICLDEVSNDLRYIVIRDPYVVMNLVLNFDLYLKMIKKNCFFIELYGIKK
jgi:hypothetical protein